MFVYFLSLLFICLFPSLPICLFTLRGWTFRWTLSEKLITWAKYVTLTILAKTPRKIDKYISNCKVKSTRKFLHALKAFRNFSFFCFPWKITWHLDKVNNKVKSERVRNWIDAQSSCLGFTSFNVPSCLLPKTTNKLLLQNLYHFMWYSKNVCS